MSISIGFHVSCRFRKSENFIKSLYNIFVYFSRFFKILIRCLVDERCSDKPTLSTKIHVTSSVLHQILSNKMVEITKNKRYEHWKLKTDTRPLNKWSNVRKSDIQIHWGFLLCFFLVYLDVRYLFWACHVHSSDFGLFLPFYLTGFDEELNL